MNPILEQIYVTMDHLPHDEAYSLITHSLAAAGKNKHLKGAVLLAAAARNTGVSQEVARKRLHRYLSDSEINNLVANPNDLCNLRTLMASGKFRGDPYRQTLVYILVLQAVGIVDTGRLRCCPAANAALQVIIQG